jgi:hypothetical protein
LRAGRTRITTVEDFRRVLQETKPGAPIMLLVRRDGEDFWVALIRP